MDQLYSITPVRYSENRVYHVGAPATAPESGRDFHRRRLYQMHETGLIPKAQNADGTTEDRMIVKNGDPLSVIISGVRLPDDLRGRYDIAVVLDVMTGGQQEQSLVVWYQRDVPGGQMLNFRDLLVYFDPSWDASFPPFFRVRVIDAAPARESPGTLALLDQVGDMSLALGGLMPSPIIPGVGLAMEAARQLLDNHRSAVLLDFTVQFYSEEQRRQAGGELGQFRKGAWLVIGRPEAMSAATSGVPPTQVAGTAEMHDVLPAPGNDNTTPVASAPVPSDFWRRTLFVDQQTGQIHDASGRRMNVPYVAVTISTARSQVPSIVVKRSEQLIQLLAAPDGKASTTDLELHSRLLASSVMGYVAERRLMRFRTPAEVDGIVNMIKRHAVAMNSREVAGASEDVLPVETYQQLVGIISRLVGGRQFSSPEELGTWWDEMKARNPRIIPDANSELGFRLEES